MDWSKAKSVLIVALIVTNIFLVFSARKVIFGEGHDYANINDFADYAVSFLEERGLEIEVEIPSSTVFMPTITVEYEFFEHAETAKRFLGSEYEVIDENTFSSGGKTLNIESNKILTLFDHTKKSSNRKIDNEEIVEYSKEFLYKHSLKREELSLEEINTNEVDGAGIVYEVVYKQRHGDFFLGNSYVYVYVNYYGVIEARIKLLRVKDTGEQKKETISAVEAIVKALGEIKAQNTETVSVAQVELGYYFSGRDNRILEWDVIKSGTAVPTWKIMLSNGNVHYIEAVKN